MALWLVRAPGPSWCTCREAIACVVGANQAGCPWCGCGWLFSCVLCRKAFAFATARELGYSLDVARRMDLDGFVRDGLASSSASPLTENEEMLVRDHERRTRRIDEVSAGLVEGAEYAVLDGLACKTGEPVKFSGIYGAHTWSVLPQERLRDNLFERGPANPLADKTYWFLARGLSRTGVP